MASEEVDGLELRSSMDSDHTDDDDDVVEIEPIDEYDYHKAKIASSLSWLLHKAFGSHVPEEFRDPFYEQNGVYHIKNNLAHLLSSSEGYCQACKNLFPDSSIQWNGHQSVIGALSRKGIYVIDSDEVAITGTVLSHMAPFRLNSHLTMIDSLMKAYLQDMVTIERVVHAVKRFTSFVASQELPMDSESALIFWMNKVTETVLDRFSSGEGSSPRVIQGQTTQRVRIARKNLVEKPRPDIPVVQDLSRDLSDGCCLCVLISFYCPDFLKFSDICLKPNIGIADSLYNIRLCKTFCRRYLPPRCFHFTYEDLLYSRSNLRLNVVALLAELFVAFEMGALDDLRASHNRSDRAAETRPAGCRGDALVTPSISRATKMSFQQQQPQVTDDEAAKRISVHDHPSLLTKRHSASSDHNIDCTRLSPDGVSSPQPQNQSMSLTAWPDNPAPTGTSTDTVGLLHNVSIDSNDSFSDDQFPLQDLQSLQRNQRAEEIQRGDGPTGRGSNSTNRTEILEPLQAAVRHSIDRASGSGSRYSNKGPVKHEFHQVGTTRSYEQRQAAQLLPSTDDMDLNTPHRSDGLPEVHASMGVENVSKTYSLLNKAVDDERIQMMSSSVSGENERTDVIIEQRRLADEPHEYSVDQTPLADSNQTLVGYSNEASNTKRNKPENLKIAKFSKAPVLIETQNTQTAVLPGKAKITNFAEIKQIRENIDNSGYVFMQNKSDWSNMAPSQTSFRATFENRKSELGVKNGDVITERAEMSSSQDSSNQENQESLRPLASELTQIRLKMEEKRKLAEREKLRKEVARYKQKQRLGKAVLLNKVNLEFDQQTQKVEPVTNGDATSRNSSVAFKQSSPRDAKDSVIEILPNRGSRPNVDIADSVRRSMGDAAVINTQINDSPINDGTAVDEGKGVKSDPGTFSRENIQLTIDKVRRNWCTDGIMQNLACLPVQDPDLDSPVTENAIIPSATVAEMPAEPERDVKTMTAVGPRRIPSSSPSPEVTPPKADRGSQKFVADQSLLRSNNNHHEPLERPTVEPPRATLGEITQMRPILDYGSNISPRPRGNGYQYQPHHPKSALDEAMSLVSGQHVVQAVNGTEVTETYDEYNQKIDRLNHNLTELQGEIMRLSLKQNHGNAAEPNTTYRNHLMTSSARDACASNRNKSPLDYAYDLLQSSQQTAPAIPSSETVRGVPQRPVSAAPYNNGPAQPYVVPGAVAFHQPYVMSSVRADGPAPSQLIPKNKTAFSQPERPGPHGRYDLHPLLPSHDKIWGRDSLGGRKPNESLDLQYIPEKVSVPVKDVGSSPRGKEPSPEETEAMVTGTEGFYVSFAETSPLKPKPKIGSRERLKKKPADAEARIRSTASPVRPERLSQSYDQDSMIAGDTSMDGSLHQPAVGFVVADRLGSIDPLTDEEMMRRRERIVEQQNKRREDQEEKRLRKEIQLSDKARKSKEDSERRKDDDRKRREVIFQKYIEKKSAAGDDDNERVVSHKVAKRGSSVGRPRPQSMYVKKVEDTRGVHVGQTADGNEWRRPQDHLNATVRLRSSAKRGRIWRPDVSGHGTRRNSRMQESGSDGSTTSIEYNGPKLFVKPQHRSNRHLILNAISHVSLAGPVNADTKNKVLEEIARAEACHFIILFREGGYQYRGLYAYVPEACDASRVHGIGPRVVTNEMVHKFYKYNSGTKSFSEITPNRHLSVTIDAIVLQNSSWQTKGNVKKTHLY